MLYELELGQSTAEATKSICCVKGEGAVDHNAVTSLLKKILLSLQEPQRSSKVR